MPSVYRAWSGYDDAGTAIAYSEEGRKEDMGQPLSNKVGGEVEVKALNSGDYDIGVYASADDNDYSFLGNVNLYATGPVVGTALLDGTAILTELGQVRAKFHLDSLGEWRTIQLKLEHLVANGSDNITIYERSIVTFPAEYYSE